MTRTYALLMDTLSAFTFIAFAAGSRKSADRLYSLSQFALAMPKNCRAVFKLQLCERLIANPGCSTGIKKTKHVSDHRTVSAQLVIGRPHGASACETTMPTCMNE